MTESEAAGNEGDVAWAAMRRMFLDRRVALGYSQRRVARDMGTAQSQLSDLETGKVANPNIDTLRKWAAALHMKVSLKVEFEEVVIRARTITLKLDDELRGLDN